MKSLGLFVASALALSASAEGNANAAAGRTTAKAAASAGSPSDIVDAIYRRFVFGMGNRNSDYRLAPWSLELRSWLARDDRATPAGEIGVFDSVPFCDCQDTSPAWRVHSKTVSRTGNSARVEAFLGRDRFVYDLKVEGNRWVIADIHSPLNHSLLTMLRREVPRAEKRRHQ